MTEEQWCTERAPIEFLCEVCKGYGGTAWDPTGGMAQSCVKCDESGLKLVAAFCDEGAKFDALLRTAEGYRNDARYYKGERRQFRINRALLAEHRAEMMVA